MGRTQQRALNPSAAQTELNSSADVKLSGAIVNSQPILRFSFDFLEMRSPTCFTVQVDKSKDISSTALGAAIKTTARSVNLALLNL